MAATSRTLKFIVDSITIVDSLNVVGSSGVLMSIDSASAGTHTISKSGGMVSIDYVSIKNSLATGGATFYAGTHSTDAGGNTGWLFSAPILSSRNRMMMGIGS